MHTNGNMYFSNDGNEESPPAGVGVLRGVTLNWSVLHNVIVLILQYTPTWTHIKAWHELPGSLTDTQTHSQSAWFVYSDSRCNTSKLRP